MESSGGLLMQVFHLVLLCHTIKLTLFPGLKYEMCLKLTTLSMIQTLKSPCESHYQQVHHFGIVSKIDPIFCRIFRVKCRYEHANFLERSLLP